MSSDMRKSTLGLRTGVAGVCAGAAPGMAAAAEAAATVPRNSRRVQRLVEVIKASSGKPDARGKVPGYRQFWRLQSPPENPHGNLPPTPKALIVDFSDIARHHPDRPSVSSADETDRPHLQSGLQVLL